MLDGLRAVAVLVVILGHKWSTIPADLGVSIFFVLSGFLITLLLIREMDRTGRVSLSQFYLRRTLRIFPAYYCFLVVSFFADFILGDVRFLEMGGWALTYLVNYFNATNGHPSTSVAHAWSLAVEEQFYLLWPMLFIGLSRWGRRGLKSGLIILILIVLAWRCWAWFLLDFPTAWIYNAFDTRFDNLAVGCLLAVTVTSPNGQGSAPDLPKRWWMPLVTIGLLAVSRSVLPAREWHYGLGFTVDAALIAVIMLQLLQFATHPAWSWLDSPVMRYLGAISYPMYLYHAWGMAAGERASPFPPAIQVVLGIGITVLLGTASYRLVESPFLKLKSRLSARTALSAPTDLGGLA